MWFVWVNIGNNYVLFCSSVDRCDFFGSILVIIMFCFAVVLMGVICFVGFAVVLTGVICLQAGVPRGGDGGRELCGRWLRAAAQWNWENHDDGGELDHRLGISWLTVDHCHAKLVCGNYCETDLENSWHCEDAVDEGNMLIITYPFFSILTLFDFFYIGVCLFVLALI